MDVQQILERIRTQNGSGRTTKKDRKWLSKQILEGEISGPEYHIQVGQVFAKVKRGTMFKFLEACNSEKAI